MAVVNMSNMEVMLKLGESIIVPAHAIHSFTTTKPFKMITTTIKSEYEL
ncbi:hypothetical protein [Sphingobacterium faecium]